MTMFKVFISVLAAIEVDRLIWNKIKQYQMRKRINSIVDEKVDKFIKDNLPICRTITVDKNTSTDEIMQKIREDIERIKQNDKH